MAIADKLAGELFAEGSPADLVERYARKLPLSVICELLGLPLADRPKFMTWANTVSRITGSLVSFWHMMRAYQGEIACWRGPQRGGAVRSRHDQPATGKAFRES